MNNTKLHLLFEQFKSVRLLTPFVVNNSYNFVSFCKIIQGGHGSAKRPEDGVAVRRDDRRVAASLDAGDGRTDDRRLVKTFSFKS
jgi:hypothetical protein